MLAIYMSKSQMPSIQTYLRKVYSKVNHTGLVRVILNKSTASDMQK